MPGLWGFEGVGGVAGVHAPAFVERLGRCRGAPAPKRVSPGFTPRPSLSDTDMPAAEYHADPGVAGVHAPAFVERRGARADVGYG